LKGIYFLINISTS